MVPRPLPEVMETSVTLELVTFSPLSRATAPGRVNSEPVRTVCPSSFRARRVGTPSPFSSATSSR